MAGRDKLDIQKRKQELLEELEASRIAISMGRGLVKDSCNVKKRVARSIGENRNKWVIGSVFGGVLVSSLLSRRGKKSTEKKSVAGWAKGVVMGMVIRKAKSVAIEKARLMLMQKIQQRNAPE